MIRRHRFGFKRALAGFTLMELVVVLALLGMMAAMSAPMAELVVQRRKEETLREALRDIRAAIDRYKAAADQGMVERRIGDSGYPPNLEILVNGVVNQRSAAKEKMFFIRQLPRDPFNPTQEGAAASSWKVRSFASPPDAPVAGADVFDVVTRATGVGLNGVPYSEW